MHSIYIATCQSDEISPDSLIVAGFSLDIKPQECINNLDVLYPGIKHECYAYFIEGDTKHRSVEKILHGKLGGKSTDPSDKHCRHGRYGSSAKRALRIFIKSIEKKTGYYTDHKFCFNCQCEQYFSTKIPIIER